MSREHFSIRALTCAVLTCLGTGSVQAAQPDAGTLLNSTRMPSSLPQPESSVLPATPAPAPAAQPDTARFLVKAFRITGNSVFDGKTLHALVDGATGKRLTLAELDAVAARITRYYHKAGYLLARAYLPAQTIRHGVVRIAVLEGRLGKLAVRNDSTIATPRLTARLANIRKGVPLDGNALERDLLLINDLPGVAVRSTLSPGASVGTTNLDVRFERRSPYSAHVTMDNFGNRYTGAYRLSGSFAVGNLAGRGDTLALRALASDGMNYERLAWQLPVGVSGAQVGAAWSQMRYRLGRDFSSLDAHGTARIGSLYLLYPILRSRRTNLNAQLAYDRKRLDDRIGTTATRTLTDIDLYTLGLSASRFDDLGGGGLTQASLAYSSGQLGLNSASRALDAAGYRTAGHFAKLDYSVVRLQRLGGRFSLYADLQGQAASGNLASAEKMSLGGALGVRAYPQGEASSDDAWLTRLELRYSLNAAWQARIFYDAASGRLHHHPLPGDSHNVRSLSGHGLGVSYRAGSGLRLQGDVAWRDGAAPTSGSDRTPRFWISAEQSF